MDAHDVRHEALGLEAKRGAVCRLGANHLGLEVSRPGMNVTRAAAARRVPQRPDAAVRIDETVHGQGDDLGAGARRERRGEMHVLGRKILVDEQDAHAGRSVYPSLKPRRNRLSTGSAR